MKIKQIVKSHAPRQEETPPEPSTPSNSPPKARIQKADMGGVLYLISILATLAVLDILMFFFLPLPGIELDPDYQCSGELGFMAAGCAYVGHPPGITKIPSFAVAFHEYLHTLGADELQASAASIIQVVLMALLVVRVGEWAVWRWDG